MSPLGQTSSVEGFHSLVNQFAPKMYHFKYPAMVRKSDGSLQYSIHFPKFKKGGYTVRQVAVEPTYEYVGTLMHKVRNLIEFNDIAPAHAARAPANLCQDYDHPNKDEAVRQHLTRFPVPQ